MTAAVILNIVFAAFVLVGMFSLLGGAIIADRRATGPRLDRSRGIPAVRPTVRPRVVRWGRRVDPAI